MADGKLQWRQRIDSAVLSEAIKQYNTGDFNAALTALERARAPREQIVKTVIMLWIAGRLETEIEEEAVPKALEILRPYLSQHPHEYGLAQHLSDAEIFQKAMNLHRKRGQLGKNHFLENDKAIGW